MKDQYFGDINDYRKYGLLRTVQPRGEGRVLVAWMLTPDDGSRDGKFRSYLEQPAKWRHFDPELYDGLSGLLESAAKPRVSLIERADLLAGMSYYSAIVPDGREDREVWRSGLLDAASGIDLVFLDPDNGFEIPSRPIGRKGSSKYVAWREVEELWATGCSLLIYQHFRHEPRETFCERMVSEMRQRIGAPFIRSLRTAHVLFPFAAQAGHETWLREAACRCLSRWKGQIGLPTIANNSFNPDANPLRGLGAG